MPADKPSKPVTQIRGTNTTADPANCPGSGKPWGNGGTCPICGVTANTLVTQGYPARRGPDLAPRVPRHPTGAPDGTASQKTGTVTVTNKQVTGPGFTRTSPARPRPRRPVTHSSVSTGDQSVQRKSTTDRPLPSSPLPDQGKRPGKPATAPTRKADGSPGPAKHAPKVTRSTADPLTKPFTANIEAYVIWLQDTLRTAGMDFARIDRVRLAGLSITMYGKYQSSDGRRAERNKS